MPLKARFFYAHGTAYLINVLEIGLTIPLPMFTTNPGGVGADEFTTATVSGLNGQTVQWDGSPADDPFPGLLDPNKWEVTKVRYPASGLAMSQSIDYGIDQVIAEVNKMPRDQPWAVGGYSQGGAVAAGVYNEVRYGSLSSRASSFLGGVCFGSPRRQQDWRGPVGGTWSGAWDVEDSTVGGRGSFPDAGPWARLSNCGDEWVEFTAPGDIFSSTGSSTFGQLWVDANNAFLTIGSGGLVQFFSSLAGGIADAVQAALAQAGQVNSFIDAAGKLFQIAGSGHTAYAFEPPVGLTGATSFQLALEHLEGLADQWAVAPIALPPSSAGWSTRLLPPPVVN